MSFSEHAQLLDKAQRQFVEAIELKKQFIAKGNHLNTLVLMADTIAQAIAKGGKLMLCGNGGSAADAQHLACELLVRLRSRLNREAIPAISLALDTSTITACANDYGFECLFERMLQALGRSGDVLLGLTTSGRSLNITRALKAAQQRGIITLGFLGSDGGHALAECDHSIVIPSSDPNRVQEVHITMGHILMDLVEGLMVERKHIARLESASTVSGSTA